MLAWGFTEKIRTGHYTAIGAASGIVAGLVAITPAADVVSPLWSIVLGAIAGICTCLACSLKYKLGYDDSLDVVGVHGVGGLIGTVALGFFMQAGIQESLELRIGIKPCVLFFYFFRFDPITTVSFLPIFFGHPDLYRQVFL